MELGQRAAGIGALADDTRRALYGYVATQPAPVGREQAATALELALHTASFHLDRLVAEGLLEVEYRRLTGRTGPGAGRPSKLYRRAAREFTVSLPPRRYDLVGDILATAVDRAATGIPLEEALATTAHDEGSSLGRASGTTGTLDALAAVLADQGYEPTLSEDTLELANCPFDSLARKHTELVCSLNRSYVQGVADGLGCTGVAARLEPEPGHCCVKARVES
ncbi:MAG TPA: helix-turn-helix domain-containing protein [Nocardioides sp.]|uniref:helix-turn-helix transcriptional regulator n=1 Tax=Nocardioides sp. TaxID=35761 RepID=UPI002E2FF248|nr:helix-turn-helix domain-containing protein [Nocardioides sp.]HEX5088012.1 helix-turn-helix domain-containing protein [Nocardioides sp.]